MLKKERQNRILELIHKYKFETQDEVLAKLLEDGYRVTQATISRDLRELQLVKSLNDNGGYSYIISPDAVKASMPSFSAVLSESIKTVSFSESMIVIKTFPGMAQAVATCIDSIDTGEILGCVAGDDAIIAVASDKLSAENVCARLQMLIKPHHKHKFR